MNADKNWAVTSWPTSRLLCRKRRRCRSILR